MTTMQMKPGRGRGGGRGTGGGRGRGGGRGAGGGGRNPGGQGLGSGGFCVCARCGYRTAHTPGVPCMDQRCPDCGAALVREGAEHHQKIAAARAAKSED